MKLTKAIELLQGLHKALNSPIHDDHKDAVKLGIEALKHHKKLRDAHPYSNYKILPGEDLPEDSNRSLHHIKAVLESPLGKEPKG